MAEAESYKEAYIEPNYSSPIFSFYSQADQVGIKRTLMATASRQCDPS